MLLGHSVIVAPTRQFLSGFSGSMSFVHTRSSVSFTIITSGFEFSVHTMALVQVPGIDALVSGAIAFSISISCFMKRIPTTASTLRMTSNVKPIAAT